MLEFEASSNAQLIIYIGPYTNDPNNLGLGVLGITTSRVFGSKDGQTYIVKKGTRGVIEDIDEKKEEAIVTFIQYQTRGADGNGVLVGIRVPLKQITIKKVKVKYTGKGNTYAIDFHAYCIDPKKKVIDFDNVSK